MPDTSEPPAPKVGDGDPDVEAAYLEHARWLQEWHEKRSEAFITRATALLGFTGVLLALLLQLVVRPGFSPGVSTWFALAACLIPLTFSAHCSMAVLGARETIIPSIDQLREQWSDYLAQRGSGRPVRDIAESFIVREDSSAGSPLTEAKKAADDRACAFAWATRSLFWGLMGIVWLTIEVAVRA